MSAVITKPRSWMTDSNVSDLVSAMEEAADIARDVVTPLFRSDLNAISKGDGSPVTEADRRAELAMRDVFERRYPDYGLHGEEFGCDRPDASLRWVLDPVDGTRAFITGRPVFGTLIALMDEDEPVMGLIDQPISGERWIGVAGQTTRFNQNIKGKVGTRKCPELASAEMSCTAPDMVPMEPGSGWSQLAGTVRRVSWGGDCYAYGLMALGQIDVIAEGDLKIWDWAAVKPVVEGAGGLLVDWEGKPPGPDCDGRILALGDPSLLQEAVSLLNV
ncbi:inositol monophosphatase family protein [Ponticaulis sp.]|uniref:inositol monophosphatase family protein n=1 Tax=Ponticaulis sp. TaxID=2020902 RepID=UPI0025CE102D|nr:inositol monophosphatase family protein [Ponticaulis sp.]